MRSLLVFALLAVAAFGHHTGGYGYHGRAGHHGYFGAIGHVHHYHLHEKARHGSHEKHSGESHENQDDHEVYRFMVGDVQGAYEYVDDDGYLKGLSIDIIDAVCQKAGKTCYYLRDSYHNCWDTTGEHELPGEGLLSGWYDGCMGMFASPERLNSFNFTVPFTPNPTAALHFRDEAHSGEHHRKKREAAEPAKAAAENEVEKVEAVKVEEKSAEDIKVEEDHHKEESEHVDESGSGVVEDEGAAPEASSEQPCIDGDKVGFLDGFAIGQPCLQRQDNIHGNKKGQYIPVEFTTHREMMEALQGGKVDAVLTVTEYSKHNKGVHAVDPHFHCTSSGLAVMTHYGSPLLEWWNSAFNDLHESGDFHKLCEEGKEKHGHRGHIFCI